MQPRLLHHPLRLAGASLLSVQSDERLVGLAREGHEPAFAAIVERYRTPLQRYCTRLLGPGRAEDAVQQAFVNAHHAMSTTDTDIQLRPWLYRVAHNAALNILRASRDEAQLDAARPGAIRVEEEVELRQRLHETLAAIQALPTVQRDAILLRELEGRSHVEIAAALGVTAGAARQHLMRARAGLRSAMSAITPMPFLLRLTQAMAAGDPGSGNVADTVAGAGAAAMVAKVGAGVLATGALVGGIAAGPMHHPAPARATTARAAVRAPSSAAGAALAPAAITTARPGTTLPAPSAHPDHSPGRPGGRRERGSSRRRGGDEAHGTAGAREPSEDRGPSEDHGGSPERTGDDHRSGTSGGTGDDHSGTSSGSSGESHETTTTTDVSPSGEGGGTSGGSGETLSSGSSGGSGTSGGDATSSDGVEDPLRTDGSGG